MNAENAERVDAAETTPLKIETRMREPATESFSFRTTPEEAEKIKKRAEEAKVTSSDIVRSALHSTGVI